MDAAAEKIGSHGWEDLGHRQSAGRPQYRNWGSCEAAAEGMAIGRHEEAEPSFGWMRDEHFGCSKGDRSDSWPWSGQAE